MRPKDSFAVVEDALNKIVVKKPCIMTIEFESLETVTIETVETIVGGKPHEALFILGDTVHDCL